MKIMNPDYKKIKVEPLNIWAREEIGKILKVKDIKKIDAAIDEMLKNSSKYQKKISALKKDSVYNLGKSAEISADYIINCVQEIIKERKKK